MRVFGLGLPELVVILTVVLLIFGPKNLPKLGAMLGRTVRKIRGRADEGLESAEEDGDVPAPKTKVKKRVVKRVVRKPVSADTSEALAESQAPAGGKID